MNNVTESAPGTWYACGDEVLIDLGDRPHLVATIADWSEDTEPYARLIAAAPALLEALQAYVADDYPAGGDSRASRIFDAARAAIAKATGSAA